MRSCPDYKTLIDHGKLLFSLEDYENAIDAFQEARRLASACNAYSSRLISALLGRSA